jgi:hypothetical protein
MRPVIAGKGVEKVRRPTSWQAETTLCWRAISAPGARINHNCCWLETGAKKKAGGVNYKSNPRRQPSLSALCSAAYTVHNNKCVTFIVLKGGTEHAAQLRRQKSAATYFRHQAATAQRDMTLDMTGGSGSNHGANP